jgi:hypothetical protein
VKRKLPAYGIVSLVLYFCLFIFHWATPPFDPRFKVMVKKLIWRLSLQLFPGARFFANQLTNHTTASIVFTIIVTLLFVFYFLALREARRPGRFGRDRTIILFIVIFATGNLLFFPWLSNDIFQYGFLGKAVRVHGTSPLTETVHSINEDEYDKILYWKDTTTPYGPLSVFLYSAIYSPTGSTISNAWSARMLALAFFLGTIAIVGFYLRRHAPSRLDYALLLMGWNPLVLIEGVANAHNDIMVGFLLALSAILVLRDRFHIALIALAASALTKYITLMMLPLYGGYAFLRTCPLKKKITDILWGICGAAVIAIICYLPFWEGGGTLSWVGSHLNLSGRSFHWMLRRALSLGDYPFGFLSWAFGGLLLLYVLMLVRRCRSPLDLLWRGTMLMFFYLIFCCFFNHPWYLLWIVPLVALARSDAADTILNVYCFTSILGYYPLLYLTRCEDPGTVWWMSLATVVTPAALFIFYYFPRRLNR